jgi:glycolate oxidase FAD binding subunit
MSTVARPGIQSDAIAGSVPRVVYSPQSIDEAKEIVALTDRERMRTCFVGGGTDLELGGALSGLDAAVRTGGLGRIVEHAPSDMIVTAEAGTTLATLQAALATERQRLAIDPPLPERATLGGIIAANAFGPRRTRYGSIRDLIIGISIIRADGALVRGGGKVVKNVAGFDVPKLLCGSLGTLAMIATATFRLHPAPEAEATILIPGQTAAGVRQLMARIKAAQLEPTSVIALSREPGRFDTALRFEGFAAGVAQQCQRLAQLQTTAGEPCEILTQPQAQELWQEHDAARTNGTLQVKISALPAKLEAVAPAVAPFFETLSSARFIWYPTLGLGFATGTPVETEHSVRALGALRASLADSGSWAVLHAAPPEIRAAVNVWGSPPAAFAIMERMKDRFDPQRRLNPGRFVGGL